MLRKIFIVKPDPKPAAAHKLFAIVIKLFVMSKVEIIDKSTGSYCLANPGLLFL